MHQIHSAISHLFSSFPSFKNTFCLFVFLICHCSLHQKLHICTKKKVWSEESVKSSIIHISAPPGSCFSKLVFLKRFASQAVNRLFPLSKSHSCFFYYIFDCNSISPEKRPLDGFSFVLTPRIPVCTWTGTACCFLIWSDFCFHANSFPGWCFVCFQKRPFRLYNELGI